MLREVIDVKQTMKDIRAGKAYKSSDLKIEIYDKMKDTFKISVLTKGDESEDIISAKHVRYLLRIF